VRENRHLKRGRRRKKKKEDRGIRERYSTGADLSPLCFLQTEKFGFYERCTSKPLGLPGYQTAAVVVGCGVVPRADAEQILANQVRQKHFPSR
jgi:hypothetical protein